ncbi:biotin transport system substrate-specific component [Ensifer adhaerens]|nr:biotin transport system substrate-specific component [Ensifer adhaerens]
MTTKDIVLVALFAAIIVVLGFLPPITIPLIAAVPITAQSMGVMLAGCIIGARRGAAAYVLVILMVAVGLPVLSGGRGGLSVLMGPTAGYIAGWVFGAFVTGLIAERMVHEGHSEMRQYAGFFLASIVGGIAVVYACGIAWLCISTGTPLAKALVGNLAFIPGDLIKAAMTAIAARAVLTGYPLLPSRA